MSSSAVTKERIERAYKTARELEASELFNACDMAHELDLALMAIEFASKTLSREPDHRAALALAEIASDEDFWNLVERVAILLPTMGATAITDEHVRDAFMIQRRIRKRYRALRDASLL